MSQCPYCDTPLPGSVTPLSGALIYGCNSCLNAFSVTWMGGRPTCARLESCQDIRYIAQPGSIGEALLKALPKTVERLPVLPEVSQRVLALTGDPNASMMDLARVIRDEQVIALSVMRLANSAMYGGLSEIKDLTTACARLGMQNIANVTQTVANANLFITGSKALRENMHRLQRHAVATAHCTAAIAKMISEPRGEIAFLAGLIHDIGKVALLDMIANDYGGQLSTLREKPELLGEVIDNFHAICGLHLVQAWTLPPEFGTLVFCADTPGLCPNDHLRMMVHALCLANAVVTLEGYGVFDEEPQYLTNNTSARFLNLTDIRLAALRADLVEKLDTFLDAVAAPQ